MSTAPLFILSGPSGSGKTTVVDRLIRESGLPLHRAVTATTREARTGEVDGRDYFFLNRPRFEEMIGVGELLESATVHGQYYGTPRSEVEPYRLKGVGVILVIDVQGAAQVRMQVQDAVTVFLTTSSLNVLKERLRGRGSETDESINRRLATAQRELGRIDEYQYRVINDRLDDAVRDLTAIVQKHFSEAGHAG